MGAFHRFSCLMFSIFGNMLGVAILWYFIKHLGFNGFLELFLSDEPMRALFMFSVYGIVSGLYFLFLSVKKVSAPTH